MSGVLQGKKVFIKRGEYQARIAQVVGQLDEQRYLLRLDGNGAQCACEKRDFVPLRRHRRAFHY